MVSDLKFHLHQPNHNRFKSIISFSIYISMIILANGNCWLAIIPLLLIIGLGQGLFLPTVQTMLVGFSPMKERAAFMSLNSMVLRIGQTTGPLVMGVGYTFGGFLCL